MRVRSFIALLLAGVASILLAVIVVPQMNADTPKGSDILVQVLGGTTDVAAAATYQEADTYFHAGVNDENESLQDEAGTALPGHTQRVSNGSDLPLMGVMRYLHGETAPKEHKHVTGAEEKELIPWFEATIRLNPHHIEAWCTGAYWYARTGDSKKALAFITEGVKNNPSSCEVHLERGIILHSLKRWTEATRDLKRAEALWKNDGDDAVFTLRAIHSYQRDCEEHMTRDGVRMTQGQTPAARSL